MCGKLLIFQKNQQFATHRLHDGLSEEDRKRFCREIRIQEALHHKNIMPILESNIVDSRPYFCMPLAERSLKDYLRDDFGEGCLWIWEQIAEAVEYAHREGVIHRDLKPENVLLLRNEEGDLFGVVGDFGLGRLLVRDTVTLTATADALGTLAYAAPEQIRNAKTANRPADIYALGKLLYEILSGEEPFPTMDLDKVPPRFIFAIQKATADDPARRYSSVSEFLKEIRALKPSAALISAEELIQQELKNVAQSGLSDTRLEMLARLVAENVDDDEVLMRELPQFSSEVLHALVRNHRDGMLRTIRKYDEKVSGSLDFGYCDIAANFYSALYDPEGSAEINTMILTRLSSTLRRITQSVARALLAKAGRLLPVGNPQSRALIFHDADRT